MDSNITFKPWIGKNYGEDTSIFNKRTLILGGSHYLEDTTPNEDISEFTNEIIDLYFNPSEKGKWKKTFSTFINSIFNKNADPQERRAFFDSIIFYNYLQEGAGDSPYNAGKSNYGADRHFNAFKEILNAHKPETIIAWGDLVWNALPNDWGFGEADKGKGILISGKEFLTYYNYPYQDTKILLIGTHHPSIGYSRDYHHQIFRELNVIS